MESKNSTNKKKLYFSILDKLKQGTNLSKIRNELNISKQKLNYYLKKLKESGIIIQKGMGWYEVKEVKDLTKYDVPLSKDSIRGHAYVWTIRLPKEIKGWSKRTEILKEKGINFNLVGALKTTPRIKVLGRKVWLCNNHIRIFDKKEASYYGKTAKESKYMALNEVKSLVGTLERKLGVFLNPVDISFNKEHYALIKNDLAIEENRKGNIIRISDESGEWLLIDDSLEKGGELENIGKSAYKTNIPMQKWWNNKKEHDFKITDDFILNRFNDTNNSINQLITLQEDLPKNMQLLAQQIESHLKLIQDYRKENIAWRKSKEKEIKEELKLGHQSKLNDFKI
mgnify:CR=1 FL=1